MNDLENKYKEVLQIIKNSLNDKIQAINLEKSDDISLETIDDNAFYEGLEGRVINHNTYFYFDILEAKGAHRRVNALFCCLICFNLSGDAIADKFKTLRYARAIQELLLEAEQQGYFHAMEDIEVSQVSYSARLMEQQITKVAGCEIGFTLSY